VSRIVMCAFLLFLSFGFADPVTPPRKPIESASLEETVAVLNKSAWARQQTYTRLVGGIGSGVFGEKELYSTFFVRFLSAPPIRQALLRLAELGSGHEELDEVRRQELAAAVRALERPSQNFIVVTVNFRSNDPDTERSMKQFFQSQTLETVKNRVYLSTVRHPNVPVVAYFPPRGDGLGARFVFPRQIDSDPVVAASDQTVSFQLDVPTSESDVVVSFPISQMVVNGELLL